MRRTITALAAALTLAGGTVAPALASSHVPPPVGAYKLCLKSDHSLCVKSNGVQNQATVVSSGYATFSPAQVVNSSTDIWYGQGGPCLRNKTNNTVEFSTSCSGDSQSYWVEHSDATLTTYLGGLNLSVHSDTAGAAVDAGDSWRLVFLGT